MQTFQIKKIGSVTIILLLFISLACKKNNQETTSFSQRIYYNPDQFIMGNDLSYLNHILDHEGSYSDSGKVEDPYHIIRKYGGNVARFRLFHTPSWTKDIYDPPGNQMYHDYRDVKKGIQKAKSLGMQVCLDFHYSDNWADPGKQVPPSAWQNLGLEDLHDSIYNYTYKTLSNLDNAGLMPDYVQVGNEINPGFVLPLGNRWDGNEGVRDAGNESLIEPKVIIHLAQPENVYHWFDGLTEKGLTDFDIIGFSYYYAWSTTPLNTINISIINIRNSLSKDVMVMETIYPWTTENADNYPNIIDPGKLPPSYPATQQGQLQYYMALTQEIIDGGGKGIFLWEPGWISSKMYTQWGQGSAWDCNTLFDFNGGTIDGMDFMTKPYSFSK
jgi:arabinogalactan endo-1,4-beta-galactosidase